MISVHSKHSDRHTLPQDEEGAPSAGPLASAAYPRQRILAVASGGGHWVQLLRMRPAFHGHDVAYLTTVRGNRAQVRSDRFYFVHDASRWNKPGLLRMAMRVLFVVLWERPDVIISTGAAVGYFAIRLGKLLGARTVWVDSVANVDHLSLSGQRIGPHADLWLTQWSHLATPSGPYYQGAVL